MLHNEIVYGVYAALTQALPDISIYNFSSAALGERIVITLLNNVEYKPMQKGELWVNIFAQKVNNEPDMVRFDALKSVVEATVNDEIDISGGDFTDLTLKKIAGIGETPVDSNENILSLIYEYRVLQTK